MERVSTGIKMSIGRSGGISRTGLRTESFRSVATGKTLSLNAFKPEPVAAPQRERFSGRNLFENTVPMVVPTMDFAKVTDPKPAPTRVVSASRFGEFKPTNTNEIKVSLPSLKLQSNNEFSVTPKPLVSVKPEITTKITAIRTELQQMTKPVQRTPEVKPEIKPEPKLEFKPAPKPEPKPEPLTQTTPLVAEQIQAEPLTVAKTDTQQQKKEAVLVTKAQTSSKQKNQLEQKTSPLTMHQELASLSDKKPTVTQKETLQKKPEETIFVAGLEIKKKKESPKDEEMKFIIDQKAKTARWMLAVKSVLFLFAMSIVTNKYHYSGEDLNLPDAPTDDGISGLAAKMGTPDATWDIWIAKVKKIPTTNIGSLIGQAIGAMEEVPPIDVKPEKAAKGEKSAPPSIVALLLGKTDAISHE